MMLEHLGEMKSAQIIEKAVKEVTGKYLKSLSAGKMGYSTTEVGDLVVKFVTDLSLD
jgi:3-isopropylmalate dehydrogenase